MIMKYDIEITTNNFIKNIDRLTNRIFKLLPLREEDGDWQSSLKNIILEFAGMSNLLKDNIDFFPLVCKLESLSTLTDADDFFDFRTIIFECLNHLNIIKNCAKEDE